jgi:hypothetical protein
LEQQFKEGVPVKGEMGEMPGPPAIARNDDSSMMPADDSTQNRPNAASDGRRGPRQPFLDQFNYPPPPPVDPLMARAFGLVLGSPEFQRR